MTNPEEDTMTKTLTQNGTDGRVYGGDPELIHVVDGTRNAMGEWLADRLEERMREKAEGRTEEEKATQLLCPGCYMVVTFDMLLELARRNGQPLEELADSMIGALTALKKGGTDRLEEIRVVLDGDDEEELPTLSEIPPATQLDHIMAANVGRI